MRCSIAFTIMFVSVLLPIPMCFGQASTTDSSLSDKISVLEARIADLEKRVALLEAQLARIPANSPTAPGLQASQLNGTYRGEAGGPPIPSPFLVAMRSEWFLPQMDKPFLAPIQ